ncbi:MAG TPA: class I SAM-dependent methyltransferase [bacterium]|nr:class I SAM-dependent methyltransferase [bacterium]
MGKVSTRELGLILGARLLKTRDLHYGLWMPDLEVAVRNVPEAQRRYSEYLMARIPADVHTILDVGCGTGGFAEQLVQKGYQVECISPSPELTRMARQRLGDSAPVFETTCEGFHSERHYDLVLFSESFQYIPLAESLGKALKVLREGGHVLISDFFRTGAPGESALRGGHDLQRFYAAVAERPFEIVSDEDITDQTAPNLDLVDQLIEDYAKPIYETAGYYLRANRPWLYRLGRRFFRRKLDRVEFKYFSHARNAAEFRKHKSYRVVLLRRKAA